MTTKELNTRDPEAIRKDLLIAQLKGANVQLQIDGQRASAQALMLDADRLQAFMPQHIEAQKVLGEELRAALEERGEVTKLPDGQVIPMTAPSAAQG